MADITALNAAVAELQADVTALLAKPQSPSQADIDAVTASVQAIDAPVKTALGQ